jgi:hypothetical protein
MTVLDDGWTGKFIAISNTPDFTRHIMPYDMEEPLVISNMVSDIYYTPDYTHTGVREIREVNIVLDMGNTAWIHIAVKAPDFQKQDDEGTPMVTSARGMGSVDTVRLEMMTLFPDLSFTDVIDLSSSGKKVRDGDPVTIIVKLENKGDISAQNVDVQLLVDGKEKKISTLRSVKNDGSDVKTVIFTWVAEPGRHEIQVVIDPENNVIESRDQFSHGGEGDNNRMSTVVDVEGSFIIKELVNDHPVVSTLLILLLSIAILLGIAYLIQGRKKQN